MMLAEKYNELISAEDYLKWELNSPTKHELIDGVISVSYTHLTLPTILLV